MKTDNSTSKLLKYSLMRRLNHQRELSCRVSGIIKWTERYAPTAITVTKIHKGQTLGERLNDNLQKDE